MRLYSVAIDLLVFLVNNSDHIGEWGNYRQTLDQRIEDCKGVGGWEVASSEGWARFPLGKIPRQELFQELRTLAPRLGFQIEEVPPINNHLDPGGGGLVVRWGVDAAMIIGPAFWTSWTEVETMANVYLS